MTLNEKTLIKWEKSTFTLLTAEQKRAILERFGNEPKPYEGQSRIFSLKYKTIFPAANS